MIIGRICINREHEGVSNARHLELIVVPYAIVILIKGANSAIVHRVRLERDVWIGRGCTRWSR